MFTADTLAYLLSLKEVGLKTAACVLLPVNLMRLENAPARRACPLQPECPFAVLRQC